MVPITAPAAKKFGNIPMQANFIDLKRKRNIIKIDIKTILILPMSEPNKLCNKLL